MKGTFSVTILALASSASKGIRTVEFLTPLNKCKSDKQRMLAWLTTEMVTGHYSFGLRALRSLASLFVRRRLLISVYRLSPSAHYAYAAYAAVVPVVPADVADAVGVDVAALVAL